MRMHKCMGEAVNVLIAVDGATTLVSVYAPSTRESHATVQCLTTWMDASPCAPKS